MYDLFVLTFNEKRYSRLQSDLIDIKFVNKSGRKTQKYYCELWPFINNCYGILYKLFTKENLGKYECCDEMFDFNIFNKSDVSLQAFIPQITADCVEDWVSMKLNDEYKDEFISVFRKLVSVSPTNTIAFLCRGQANDTEVIVGQLSCESFLDMLCSGNIKTNICYIVGRN